MATPHTYSLADALELVEQAIYSSGRQYTPALLDALDAARDAARDARAAAVVSDCLAGLSDADIAQRHDMPYTTVSPLTRPYRERGTRRRRAAAAPPPGGK